VSTGFFNGARQMTRIGLEDRKRVAPGDDGKTPSEAQLLQQRPRQTLEFVGAHG
jgi:hypothetical protein